MGSPRVEYLHVLPINDEIDHEETCGCWCQPTVEDVLPHRYLVIHHSVDGRELFEEGALPPAARH